MLKRYMVRKSLGTLDLAAPSHIYATPPVETG